MVYNTKKLKFYIVKTHQLLMLYQLILLYKHIYFNLNYLMQNSYRKGAQCEKSKINEEVKNIH